ncbi:hypothetical protein Y5A_023185, partial [Burkholderia glumae AU6208]
MNDPHQDILAATRHWLTRAVIGLNLCPFAKGVHVKEQVRYAVSEAASLEDALDDLEPELRPPAAADPAPHHTTLLTDPRAARRVRLLPTPSPVRRPPPAPPPAPSPPPHPPRPSPAPHRATRATRHT